MTNDESKYKDICKDYKETGYCGFGDKLGSQPLY